MTRTETSDLLKHLIFLGALDEQVKSLDINCVYYNAFSDMHIMVNLRFDFDASGTVALHNDINSVRMTPYQS